jgi:hypothetical protein
MESGITDPEEILVSNPHPRPLGERDILVLSQEQSRIHWEGRSKQKDGLQQAVDSIFPDGLLDGSMTPASTVSSTPDLLWGQPDVGPSVESFSSTPAASQPVATRTPMPTPVPLVTSANVAESEPRVNILEEVSKLVGGTVLQSLLGMAAPAPAPAPTVTSGVGIVAGPQAVLSPRPVAALAKRQADEDLMPQLLPEEATIIKTPSCHRDRPRSTSPPPSKRARTTPQEEVTVERASQESEVCDTLRAIHESIKGNHQRTLREMERQTRAIGRVERALTDLHAIIGRVARQREPEHTNHKQGDRQNRQSDHKIKSKVERHFNKRDK